MLKHNIDVHVVDGKFKIKQENEGKTLAPGTLERASTKGNIKYM